MEVWRLMKLIETIYLFLYGFMFSFIMLSSTLSCFVLWSRSCQLHIQRSNCLCWELLFVQLRDSAGCVNMGCFKNWAMFLVLFENECYAKSAKHRKAFFRKFIFIIPFR